MSSKNWGKFEGEVSAVWLSKGRNMLLLHDFSYWDSQGKKWFASKGSIIDGASVPWFFRRVFPIYVGRYRRATVLHDVYCESKTRSSATVHKMFYEAMRCDHTSLVSSIILWVAVRFFGPQFKGKNKG
jgi:hypothetical protein